MDSVRLLTPAQVAERLQVKTETVQGWLRNGKLQGFKLGRSWRVPEKAIGEMLKANLIDQIGPGKEHESWLDAVREDDRTARERSGGRE